MTVIILTVSSISLFAPVFHLLKLVVMVAVAATLALASTGDAEAEAETSILHLRHPLHLAVLISPLVLLLLLLDRHQEYVSR